MNLSAQAIEEVENYIHSIVLEHKKAVQQLEQATEEAIKIAEKESTDSIQQYKVEQSNLLANQLKDVQENVLKQQQIDIATLKQIVQSKETELINRVLEEVIERYGSI